MVDGTRMNRFHPNRRYSQYLINFNLAAEEFGYKFNFFSASMISGVWYFKNEHYSFPSISVRPASVHDEFNFNISFDYECRYDIKTYEDCYNVIFKSLDHKFKGKWPNGAVRRNLILSNLLNG